MCIKDEGSCTYFDIVSLLMSIQSKAHFIRIIGFRLVNSTCVGLAVKIITQVILKAPYLRLQLDDKVDRTESTDSTGNAKTGLELYPTLMA